MLKAVYFHNFGHHFHLKLISAGTISMLIIEEMLLETPPCNNIVLDFIVKEKSQYRDNAVLQKLLSPNLSII